MSIHKHNGKRGVTWEVRYRGPNGAERSRRFRTQKDAADYEREQKVNMRKGVWTDPLAGRMTLEQWSAEWQPTIVHLAQSTIRIHAGNMRLHVLPDVVNKSGKALAHGLGAHELGKLTTTQLTKWLAAMLKKPRGNGRAGTLAPATVHQVYRTLHLALQAAVACGHLGRNPLDGVKPPRVDAKPMRFLGEGEVAQLAAATDPRYRALVLMGCLCGLRAGELMALRWENVDVAGRKIQVVEQFDKESGPGAVKQPKTTAGRRAVSMPLTVVDALKAHAALMRNETVQMPVLRLVKSAAADTESLASMTGLVFTGPTGKMVNLNRFRDTVWKKAFAAAGLEHMRIHDMRHTAASLAIKAGADVKVIQRMLGHASAAMTLDTYGHLMPGQAEAVADRLDVLMQAVAV